VVASAKLNTKGGVGATLIQDRDARMRGGEPHQTGFGRTRPVKIHQTFPVWMLFAVAVMG